MGLEDDLRTGEKFPGQNAKEGVSQAIDAFEMFEKKNQPFEVGGFELAVDVVKRVRNRMADRRFLEITLQVVDVLSQRRDFRMLCFGNSPDKQMKFARIMRKMSGNFLTDKSMIKLSYFKIPFDRVVIGDRDKIHPALTK